MKLNAEYVIPIVILIFVLIISLCSSCIKFMHGEGFDNIKCNSLAYSEFEGEGGATIIPSDEEEEPDMSGQFGYETTPMGDVDYEPTPMGEMDYEPTPMGEMDYEPTPMGEMDYEPTPMGEMDYEPTPMGEADYGSVPAGDFGYMTTPAGQFGYGTTPGGKYGYGTTPGGEYEYGTTPGGEYGYGTTPGGEYGYGTTPGGEYGYGTTPGGEYEYGTTPGGEYGYGTTPFSSDEPTESGEEGFSNLNCVSARYGNRKNIDIYSQAKGDLSCEPSSYSNSSGYLCLDKNQKRQLMTRGMNQSGKSSQIGQA